MAHSENISFSEGEDETDLIHRHVYPAYDSPYNYVQSRPPVYKYSADQLTLDLQKQQQFKTVSLPPRIESPEEEISMRKYIGGSIGLISLITENLLSHPFLVLRRQCQVHHNSVKYHLIPFTLVPVIAHLHQRQGITTLWKGIGSVLLVRGMTLAAEDCIYKFSGWPKEIHSRTSMKQLGQHILLKCISLAAVVPFYSASLVETVQSDIASEKPGIFDVFKEGGARLAAWSAPQRGRMLPVWILVGPHVGLGMSKYMFGLIVKGITTRVMSRKYNQQGAKPRDVVSEEIQIYSTLTSLILTEVIFYPFETILHRLQLQGTRTIIDNLDSGYSVIPILTSYEGAVDCYRTTIASEGFAGLYKGFGSMILQFAAHIAVVKLSKWIIGQISEIVSNKPPPRVAQYYNLDHHINRNSGATQGSATMSRSVSGVSSISDEILQ